MKKKRLVYLFGPLLGLVVFIGFYLGARKEYDAKEDRVVQEAADRKKAKLEKEARDREKAVASAVESQERRRAEKKAKDEKEAKEAEARAAALQARTKAARDADKLEAQVKRLQRDVEDEKKEITKIETDKKHLVEEQGFIQEYVKAAEANVKGLQGVLEKIADADKKWEEAQKAAALAAKKPQ